MSSAPSRAQVHENITRDGPLLARLSATMRRIPRTNRRLARLLLGAAALLLWAVTVPPAVAQAASCPDVGLVTSGDLTVPKADACVTFRVNGRGVRVDDPPFRSTERLQIRRGNSVVCETSFTSFSGEWTTFDCRFGPGTYTASRSSYTPGNPAGDLPWTMRLSPLGPSSCSGYQHPLVANGALKTYVGSRVDCYFTHASAGQELYTLVQTDGRSGAGRRIRRPDGSVLCSSTSRRPAFCVADTTGPLVIETWYRPTPANADERHPYRLYYASVTQTDLLTNCTAVSAPGAWAGRRLREDSVPSCFIVDVDEDGLAYERRDSVPSLRLLGPDLTDRCVGVLGPCRLDRGRYYVVIAGSFGHFKFGVHTPTHQPVATCSKANSIAIAFDDAPLFQTWDGAEHDCMRFYGKAGQWVSAALAWSGPGRPAKRIVHADGTQVCRSGGWAPLLCRLDRSGRHYLESWRQPALAPGEVASYRASMRIFTPANIHQSGCLLVTPRSISRRRARLTDNVECFALSGNGRSWKLSLKPGATTMRVMDIAGRAVCTNAATEACQRSGTAYLFVGGRASAYGFTLSAL